MGIRRKNKASDLRWAKTVLLVLTLSTALRSQQNPDQMREWVCEALLLEQAQLHEDWNRELQQHSWEALAYVEWNDSANCAGLSEAVADSYTFGPGEIVVRLRAPEGENAASTMRVPYRLSDNRIQLMKEGQVAGEWMIWYADAHYLVLEIDGLRLFLIRQKEELQLKAGK